MDLFFFALILTVSETLIILAGNRWFSSRPKSQNNKGVVDMYRRKKLSFPVVSEIFHRF